MIIMQSPYTLPGSDMPLTHARIAHSANWLTGTVAASSTASGYFADAPDNSLTYELWSPTALPATWEIDFGSAKAMDYCVIAGHTLGTNGNTITIQYDLTSTGSWTTLASGSPTTDEPIMVIFGEVSPEKARISISGGTAPEIAVIRFGKALQMERPIYGGHSPINMNRRSVVRSTRAERGAFLGRSIIRTELSGSFAWNNLTAAWVRANIYPLLKAIEDEPFFIAWRPATFGDVNYCWTPGNPAGPSNTGQRDLMSFSMDVEALAYE